MNLDDLKEYLSKLPKIDFTQKEKIYATISLGWIIFIGYLTWWNGLKGFATDKSFKWDEWFWFGLVPAFSAISIFLYMEKKRSRR